MSEEKYSWERFWCPRSANYSLADGGYLVDPREGWSAVNSHLVTLESIADVPCLVLLGEPGIGKSSELENLRAYTDEQLIDEDDQILALDLEDYDSKDELYRDLFRSEVFSKWRHGTHRLYLFLDSLDQGWLTIKNLPSLLIKEFRSLDKIDKKYFRPGLLYLLLAIQTGLIKRDPIIKDRPNLSRLYIRITCRSAVFSTVESDFRDLWGDQLKSYDLNPLSRIHLKQALQEEKLNVDLCLQEIERAGLMSLSIKPIPLKFLIKKLHKNNGRLPDNQTIAAIYREGCKELCEEPKNKKRHPLNPASKLDVDQRLVVAARIAAITTICNRSIVSHEQSLEDDDSNKSVYIEELYGRREDTNREMGVEKIDKLVIQEVLDTGLFEFRDLELKRARWSHRNYAEFLAAWYLEHHKVPLEQIRGLIFSSEEPDRKLIPQLHETAAWLASMRPDVLEEIIKTDPDVLLQSDVPTDADVRAAIVENLLRQYEEEKLFAPFRGYYYYEKLNHPNLSEQLRPYICDSSKRSNTRELAIYIAETCKVFELQEELIDLACDPSQEIYLRAIAAKTLGDIGDANARLQLKPLAIDPLPEDEDDQLKGYALQALWPNHLTVEELFQALTPPKKWNFFGSYQSFLDNRLITQLKPKDLVIALNWLERQGVRCFRHPFETLGDAILGKAWDNFDSMGVAEGFTKVALVQRREYQEIITCDSQLQERFTSSISIDSQKRRALIEQGILQISKIEGDPYLLDAFTEDLVKTEDFLWMLNRFKNSESEQEQNTWSILISRTFQTPESMPEEAKTILEATQTPSILRDQFSYWLETIDLDSAEAVKRFTGYLRHQVSRNYKRYDYTLTPPPQERILLCLERLEAGDLNAWWQLNMEMTLRPQSKCYHNGLELDLTKLPGWQDADESTRTRIIEGAKTYIQLKDDIDYGWIGTETFKRSELSGCKALYLLLQENVDFINNLPLAKWKNWASVIIAIPAINKREDLYLELVRLAYCNTTQESINTLLILIDQDNRKHDYIFVIAHFDRCWDERLKSALLEKAKDPTLKPKCVGQILDELLRRESVEARNFAISLIPTPLPSSSSDPDREKALIATKVLIEYSDSSDWALIWSLIQEDTLFGREVFELIAHRYSRGLQLNLTETQLADLYIWLVNQYPHGEDPDYSNEAMAHIVTAREAVGHFRDNVLTQLRERSNDRACAEIERLIQELPQIPWLKKVLADTEANARRENWQPLTPEEFLQLVHRQRTSQLDIIQKTTERTERSVKQMADEPKIDRRVQINNSQVNGMINTGEGNITEGKTEPPNTEKEAGWKFWLMVSLTLIGIFLALVALFGNGIFTEEIRNFLLKRDSPPVPQNQPKLEKRIDKQ